MNAAGVVLVPDDRALFTELTDDREPLASRRTGGGPSVDDVVDLFPALRRRAQAPGRHAVRRRAADAGRGPGARPGARACCSIDEMSMGLAPGHRRVADARWSARSPTRPAPASCSSSSTSQLALEVADEAIVLVHGRRHARRRGGRSTRRHRGLEAAYLGADHDPAESETAV